MTVTAMEVVWGVNYRVATCRHVLGEDGQPVCGQSRGWFFEMEKVIRSEPDQMKARIRLTSLPVCARCKPIARAKGWQV